MSLLPIQYIGDPNETAVPEIGWRCFHCDEIFTPNQKKAAADHFGPNVASEPICKIAHRYGTVHGLVIYIRDLEHQVHHLQTESDPVSRYWYDVQSKHRQEVIDAEQKGYDKGLNDDREHYKSLLDSAEELFDVTGLATPKESI